jgi:hypothetical protein
MGKQPLYNRQDCRIVLFYRLAPDRAQRVLPDYLEPRTINGSAVGGIALVRRPLIRSSLVPRRLVTNATVIHFMSALRQRHQKTHSGSLIMRRDTSSRVGAWIFGGWNGQRRHHHARFEMEQASGAFCIDCDSDDRCMHVSLRAQPQRHLVQPSLFGTKDQLLELLHSDFARLRLVRKSRVASGSRRRTYRCQLIPLLVRHLESSLFGDSDAFPPGAAEFDSGFWLREEEFVWSEENAVCCDIAPA